MECRAETGFHFDDSTSITMESRVRRDRSAGLLLACLMWPWTPMARGARVRRTIVSYGFSIPGEVIDRGVFPEFRR
jgi:hypothetical protein